MREGRERIWRNEKGCERDFEREREDEFNRKDKEKRIMTKADS